MERTSRREHLIETAIQLFCQHCYHATGIDRILEEAGVSKKTLYHHFRSKEELIYAALRQYDGIFRNRFMKDVSEAGETPQERLLALFDVAKHWFQGDKFFGCMFINAIGEYSEDDSPIRDIVKQFKQQMWNFIADLVQQAGIHPHEDFTDSLSLLLEGAIVTAQVSQKPQAALTAKKIAEKLLETHSDDVDRHSLS